jgi:hypothetical protein
MGSRQLRQGTRLGAQSQDMAAQNDHNDVRRVLHIIDPEAPVKLSIARLRRDGGTQSRAQLDPVMIADYAEDMQKGDQFPPGIAFYDGSVYWLARGFTRTAAAESLGWTEFDYIVKQGTQRDAILFSLGENAEHGQRRTNEDKRRAVLVMLQDDEWGQLSSEIIAEHCKVSHTFVNNIRRPLATVASQGEQGKKKPDIRIGADGREYRVDRIRKAAQKRAQPKSTPSEREPSSSAVMDVPGAQALFGTLPAADEPTASEQSAQPKGVYDRAERDQTRQLILRDLKWIIENLRAIGEERRAGALELLARSWARDWGMK